MAPTTAESERLNRLEEQLGTIHRDMRETIAVEVGAAVKGAVAAMQQTLITRFTTTFEEIARQQDDKLTAAISRPGFGLSSSTVPVLGQSSNPAVPVFGQSSSNPALPVFGQSSNPAGPVFGQSSNPAVPVFGQSSNPALPVFGQSSNPAGPVFGQSSSNPALPVFGPLPVFGHSSNPTVPTFGQPLVSQSPPAFNFGSAAPSSIAALPFQFGAQPPQKKRAFRMTANEDFAELDDDSQSRLSASPSSESAGPIHTSWSNSRRQTSNSFGNDDKLTAAISRPGFGQPLVSSSNPTVPVFGQSSNPAVPVFGQSSIAAVPVFGQSSNPTVPTFGQPLVSQSPPAFNFGSAAPSSIAALPFQFGGQQNQATPQNLPPFQTSNSLVNSGGSSFSLGSGGGDKGNRKVIGRWYESSGSSFSSNCW